MDAHLHPSSVVHRPRWALLFLVVVAAQVVSLACALPWSAFGTAAGFWTIDHPYHLYQIELGRALLREGRLIGYDPFFAGGYIGGVSFNASARLPVLLSAFVPDTVTTAHLYAAYVMVAAVIAPACVVWLARVRGLTIAQGVLAAAVGFAFWWCSAFRWYETAGLVSYVLCAYLAPAYAAWLVALARDERGGTRAAAHIAAAGAIGAIGLWLHPLFCVLVIPMFGAFVAFDRVPLRARTFVLRVMVVGALIVLANVPWVLAMIGLPSLAVDQPYQRAVGLHMVVDPLLGRWTALGTFLNPLVVAACALALFGGRRAAASAAPFVAAGAFFIVFSAFGAAVHAVAMLQPNRFAVAGFLSIGIGAAVALGGSVSRWRGARLPVRGAVVLLTLAVVGYTSRETLREISSAPHGHYGKSPPELTDTPASVAAITDWIRDNTTADGRVLFELSLGRVHGGGHVAGQLALATQREFSGGAYPFSQPGQSFQDRMGLGRPLADLDVATFSAAIEDDNVGWIVAHSPGLQAFVERWGRATYAATVGPVRIYRVDRALSYVASGHARVVGRGFDRVEVADASGDEIVLKYHWVPGLVATPPARVEAAPSTSNLAPLVRVLDAPAHFVISTCARCVGP